MTKIAVNKQGFAWTQGRYVFGMEKVGNDWEFSGDHIWASGTPQIHTSEGIPKINPNIGAVINGQWVCIDIADMAKTGNKYGLEDWHIPGTWCQEIHNRALKKINL